MRRMTIRPVLPADRDEWLRMRRALWQHHTLEELSAEIAPYFQKQTIWGLPATVFVVERQGGKGTLGGFIEMSLRPYAAGCTSSPVGYVEGWYVDPDLRREGLGKKLLAAAERWARERGCSEMGSDCNADNRVSYLSHLNSGYEPTDGHIHFRKPLTIDVLPRASDDWIAIVPYDLSVDVATRLVTDPRAGGIDIFLGTTRQETAPDGGQLIALDYEAYEEMAIDQLRKLARRAREKWPIVKLAIFHRTGRVGLGEPSVIIAVSTPHRADAFEACRFLIDQLKVDVAIWKKEVWSDGTGTWVHPEEEGGKRRKGEEGIG
jgi:molybdopterin synthase catalytic subunit